MLRLLYGLIELLGNSWDAENENAEKIIREIGRKDLNEALRVRARTKRKRKILLTITRIILVIITVFAGGVAIKIFSNASEFVEYLIGGSFLISAIWAFFSVFSGSVGNITTLDIYDVLGLDAPYALYLRAFSADTKRTYFKEQELALQLLNSDIVPITVGLPEEVDAMPGFARVYISNDTWQEDVRLMMEKAACLLLRVCDTDSCLWEFENALSLNNELYIIIDDAKEYASVSSKCSCLPQNVSIIPGSYCIYRRKPDGGWEYVDPNPEGTHYESIRHDHSYQKTYVDSLLERFPMPQNASLNDYDESIKGLFSNMIQDVDHNLKMLVAERIMDIMEACFLEYGDDKNVIIRICEYLKMFERFTPLTDDLQHRKDELSRKVNLSQN